MNRFTVTEASPEIPMYDAGVISEWEPTHPAAALCSTNAISRLISFTVLVCMRWAYVSMFA